MGHEDEIPSDFLASGGLDSAIRRFGDDLIGKQIGVYHVASLLGASGMGEGYRARDTRLGRDVAIKMLSTLFASDPERLRRFEREVWMLAALSHPHIGAIYGVEEADPSPANELTAFRQLSISLDATVFAPGRLASAVAHMLPDSSTARRAQRCPRGSRTRSRHISARSRNARSERALIDRCELKSEGPPP